MALNIACAVNGCTDPVIGQCSGYQGSCGRFYCAQHSVGNLCLDCGQRKLQAEAAQKVDEDNLLAADNIENLLQKGSCRNLIVVHAVPALCAALALASYNLVYEIVPERMIDIDLASILFIVFGVAAAITYIGLYVRFFVQRRQMEKRMVSAISTSNPQFEDFYKGYKRERLKQRLFLGGAIALGAAAAAAHASEEAQLRNDVRDIRDRLAKR